MNKKIILLGCLVSTLAISAQTTEKDLNLKLEKQRVENETQFENYWNSLDNNIFKKDDKEKEELKSKIAFFYKGIPYFLSSEDTHQNSNANIDFIHDGLITGLSSGFTGNGLKLYQFDGGRIYDLHPDLDGAVGTPSQRVINGEAANVPYDTHATSVASMMISKGASLSQSQNGPVLGNTKGVAPNASIEGYAFSTTTLPGGSSPLSVHQKILQVAPPISNHSYGVNAGWRYSTANSSNLGAGWYWGGDFDATTNDRYDFQGTYFFSDESYDAIVRLNPNYIIVKSSGNYFGDGPHGNTQNAYFSTGNASTPYQQFTQTMTIPPNNCSTGYDCIGPGSLAKNIIVVGSTEKIQSNNGRYTAASDVVRSSFSSVGPRDDGGIKPDIAGVGGLIFSATYNPANNSAAYTQGSGTSFSAPNVTGIIGLWNTIYSSLFSGENLNAAKAKTLLLHSAQEAGNHPGPDAWYGWGFADAKKGAELIVGKSNASVTFEEHTLANNATFTKEITPQGNGSLKVTISWVDPEFQLPAPAQLTVADVYNNRNSKLVNDLDLRIIDTTDNSSALPWRLNINNLDAGAEKGDNTVDNVEQVVIDNAIANRTYRIEVTHKGNLKNNADQNFAIIAEGTSGLLSTAESNKKVEANIYPTIAKNSVNINLANATNGKISVYDASGKLIHKQNIKQKDSIDISSYKQGVYIISIETKEGKFSKRFIKE